MAHIEARIMYFLTITKRKLLSSLNTSFLSVKICKQLISALVLSLSGNIFIFTPPNVLPCISTSRLDRKLLQILLESRDSARQDGIKLNNLCKVFLL